MTTELHEKTHYIAITVIIRKENKYLICKRSEKEQIFPGKWCVPGGKLEQGDFTHATHDVGTYWLDVLERTASREVQEETSLTIHNVEYVSNLAFIRPNGYATIIISLCGEWSGGEVRLQEEELIDHAWVTLDEAREYDLVENLWEQMARAQNRH
jgi:8-oxo-dGTP pyrophosphatase MutT (NUDIX family)